MITVPNKPTLLQTKAEDSGAPIWQHKKTLGFTHTLLKGLEKMSGK
jgi:hypothetical protein